MKLNTFSIYSNHNYAVKCNMVTCCCGLVDDIAIAFITTTIIIIIITVNGTYIMQKESRNTLTICYINIAKFLSSICFIKNSIYMRTWVGSYIFMKLIIMK